MTFGRDKRLLLGVLAALAPLPLPMNEVVGWPSIFGFWVAVALFLRRAWHDVGGWLPNWTMNVLAVAYLPVFVLDLGVLRRGQLLQPVVHLLLFGLAVKLFSLKREKDKWHTFLVIFFLFLAATGTSVHPAVLLYIVAFLAAGLLLLSRFVTFDLLTRHPRRAPPGEHVPLGGFVTGGVLFALVVAIPLFVLMPRLRAPYVTVRAGGYGTLTQVASFQDVMRLDGIGRVRGSRTVVMRLTYESPPPPTHETRIKVKTYDRFTNDEWSRSRSTREGLRAIHRQPEGYYPLGRGRVASWMGLWMQPFSGLELGVPVDAVQFDLMPTAVETFVAGATGPSLVVDDGGGVRLPYPRSTMVRYRVGLGDQPGVAVSSPLLEPDLEANLEATEISPRVARFAARVMGDGEALERAGRAERYLSRAFEYTTELIGTPEGERIETFLFESQRGHCELFASAMVLMLRSQGIPARLATGFLGADFNPIEDYFIVRESNAHAWVEAHFDGLGWRVFDPTPPAGRPFAGETGWTDIASQLYDYLVFRWDRYVLTFGLADQIGFVASLRDLWLTVSDWFSADEPAAPRTLGEPARETLAVEPVPEAPAERAPTPWWPLTAALLFAAAGFTWFQRRRFDATAAYLRLRERLRPDYGPSLEAVAPLQVAARYAERFPGVAEPARELVELYLGESFGGCPLSAEEMRTARELLRRALRRRAA